MELLFSRQYYQIVNAATQVWKTLGYGFDKQVYENSLLVELKKRAFEVEQGKRFEVEYESYIVGEYRADLVVEKEIVLAIRTAGAIADEQTVQLWNGLRAAHVPLGIIVNFGPERMEPRRVSLDTRV